MNSKELRQLINKHFNIEELRTLCSDLDIEFDALPGEGKEAKIRELINHAERERFVINLCKELKEVRPKVNWDACIVPTTSHISNRYYDYLKLIYRIILFILLLWLLIYISFSEFELFQSSKNEFIYQISVLEQETNKPIPNASVTLELGGLVPIDEFTDSNGIARFIVDKDFLGKPGRLIIEARNHLSYRQEITLEENELPHIIQLVLSP